MMTFAGLTVAYWAVLIAALLPLFAGWLAKSGMFFKPRREGGYDNHHPRAWLADQTGWRARANAAQANGFEQLPLFIGAVLIAHQQGAPQRLIDLLAIVYVVLRLAFIAAYVGDRSTLRSLVWGLAFLVNLALFVVAGRAG